MSRFVLTAQLQLQAPNNVRQVVQQIQSQLSGVNVNVQVQGSAQAQRQLQQVTQQANQATTAAERMGRAFALSVRRFAAFSVATRAVSLFTSTLSDAVQSAIDFERQLIKVSQVTGKSVGQLRGLTRQITSLSTGFGVASSDLLEVSTVLAQAGLTAEDTAVALRTLAKAALAPNFDSITETAEGAIAILAQFQQGVGALEAQLGSINAVAGAFAVEASDLIDVIRRTGGVFKASGGSLNELLALFTSVRATTRESAESIGTGLRTIFTRIQRPKTIEFLKQFGVELVDLNGKFVGPYEAIKRLSQALAGLGEGDLTFIRIAEELGGFRQIGKVLPLLQQFTTAQQALNVATKANDSLTNDAASAQAALAIRIMKVKEEFLALIRSVTETSTFQVMANTALSLASALIKIADSIKPLLPLLAALAAFKIAKGLGGFFGGIMSGATSGRTYNQGGKVLKFARGGLVPGSGNRDTVPAMLQPGEFVIRKSSVNKMGAGTLAAMNENKYAAGGRVSSQRSLYGPKSKWQDVLKAYPQLTPNQAQRVANGTATLEKYGIQKPLTKKEKFSQAKALAKERQGLLDQYPGGVFTTRPNAIGGFFLTPEKGSDGTTLLNQDIPFTLNGNKAALVKGSTIRNYLPFRGDLAKNSTINNIVDQNAQLGVRNAVMSASDSIGGMLSGPISLNRKAIKTAANKVAKDKQVFSTIGGYMYEGILQGLTNASLAGGQANFDFPSLGPQNKKALAAFFGTNTSDISGLIKADAKRSLNSKMTDSIFAKIVGGIVAGDTRGVKQLGAISTNKIGRSRQNKIDKKFFGGIIQKFATGGEAQQPQLYTRGTLSYSIDDMKAAAQRNGMTFDKFKAMLDERKDTGWKDFVIPEWELMKRFGLSVYRPPSPYLAKVEAAKMEKEDRIATWKQKQGMLNKDYEGQSREQKEFLAARGRRRRFATGGGVGTDTVPALLTPGEFVINRSSAQRIGYGNLNRMNKVGKYARGGVVQHFAKGTSGTGAKPTFDLPAEKLVLGGLSKLDRSAITLAMGLDKISFGGFTKLIIGTNSLAKKFVGGESITQRYQKQMTYLESVLPSFSKVIERNAQLNKRNALVNADVVDSLYNLIKEVDQSGASQRQVRSAAIKYSNALAANSRDIIAGNPISAGSSKSNQASVASTSTVSSSRSTSSTSTVKPVSSPTTTSSSKSPSGPNNSGGFMNDFGMQISMISATMSSLLPPLDENASGFTKVAHSALSLTTTIGGVIFALNQFGIQLKMADIASFAKSLTTMGKGGLGEKLFGITKNKGSLTTSRAAGESVGSAFNNVGIKQRIDSGIQTLRSGASKKDPMDILASNDRQARANAIRSLRSQKSSISVPNSMTGKLGQFLGQAAGKGGIGGRLAGMAAQGISKVGMLGGIGGGAVGGMAGAAAAATGPALAVVGAVAAINSVIGSFRDLDDKLKDSIAAGKVEEASRLAVAQKASEFPLIGNIVGSIFGEAGDEFLIGISSIFGGPSVESIRQLAAAQAGAVKTQKALEEAQKTATTAMNDFKNGSISASDALAQIRLKTGEVSKQQKRAADFAATNMEQRGGIARDIGAYLGGGLFGMETSTTRNKRLGKENVEQINQASKFQAEAFSLESEARQATIRSGIARGKDMGAVRTEAMGSLASQKKQATDLAQKALQSGDIATYDAAIAQAKQIGEQMAQVEKEIANIEKEVKRAKESFQAMNLGLRSADATASALSASMSRFSSGLEVGGSTFVSDVEFLQESISSAAQAMNPDEIRDAAQNVANNLRGMGVSPQMVAKFEGNVAAFTQAQANYNQAFENVKNSMAKADFENLNADQIKKKMAEELASGLGPGVSDEARENLKKVVMNMSLEDADIDKIIAGDLSVFGDKLTEEQKKMFEPIQKIAQERAKAEQVLTEFTKKRIDAERNLVAAQQEAIDLLSEGREIQAKYGGQAVSMQEKRGNLLAKSNVEASRLGLTSMRTGDAGELRRRNAEIRGRFSQIESQRTSQGGMAGTAGVAADEEQKDLQKAYKTQIDTIRGLIKLEEEQLKITEEKNKLEKESMESLVKGDVEAFFKQQSAVGATAAIASGDQRLMNQYGAEALGTAALDIKRQQEAGVQTLYGQRLAGAGGLTEAASSAALSARGVTDMRAAQVMAGTTAEEEASKARLRELGGMLGETGELGAEMAEMQVQTANINVNSAQLKFNEVLERGNKAAEKANRAESMPATAQTKARGGLIYANRGIFVPRGTDTVPAMLTPGEFVVNRGAVQRGNNLQILQAMNGGAGVSNSDGGAAMMARGGMVRYRQEGSSNPEAASQGMTSFVVALENFNKTLSDNVQALKDTKISIKLDSTNVSINLNDGGLLKALTGQVKQELFGLIENQFKVVDGGRLKRTDGGIV